MLFHRQPNQRPFSLFINDNKIKQVNCFKYLGVRIDDKLKWTDHIKHIEGKLSSACGAMYRLREIVNQQCLRSFYFAHAYFHLQYAILAWYNTQSKYLKRLNSLHGKLIRLMTLHGPLKNFFFSADEMFKNMEILKVQDIYKLEVGKFMHRAKSRNLPETFDNHFIRIENMQSHPLRSININPFYAKPTNTAKYRKWLTNYGIELWNNFDPELKKLSYKCFSVRYKTNLLDLY